MNNYQILLIVIAILYFVPALIATIRGHTNLAAIWALNILLGWTVVGWLVAFIWSFTAGRTQQTIVNVSTAVPVDNMRGKIKCPSCAELIQSDAKKCRFCGEPVVGAR